MNHFIFLVQARTLRVAEIVGCMLACWQKGLDWRLPVVERIANIGIPLEFRRFAGDDFWRR